MLTAKHRRSDSRTVRETTRHSKFERSWKIQKRGKEAAIVAAQQQQTEKIYCFCLGSEKLKFNLLFSLPLTKLAPNQNKKLVSAVYHTEETLPSLDRSQIGNGCGKGTRKTLAICCYIARFTRLSLCA